jgi:hypothetical protein
MQEASTSMWDNPVWKALSQPPEFITKGVNKFAEHMTTPRMDLVPTGEQTVSGRYMDQARELMNWQRGFIGGAAEGAAQFLNPLDVVGMATGVGEYNAARRGATSLAKALKWGERISSAPIAAHGFERVTDPTSSLGEKAAGVAELAGGAYGAFGPPTPVRPRPGAVPPSSGPPRPPSGPLTQAPLPFGEPRTRQRPPSVEGQEILPLDYDNPVIPVKPPINQAVAEAITKPVVADTMLDVEGKGGLEADLSTIEGIQVAYTQGKLSREDALSNMNKINRRLLKKPQAEAPAQETIRATVDEQEVIIDPNTGEIISEKPYPLTEETAVGVTAPGGVDEVTNLILTRQVKNIKELQERLGVSFAKTKELWESAKEQGKLLKNKEGFYERSSTPEQAALPEMEPSRSTISIARGEADKTYIAQLRKDGYEFQGLDEEGNYIFGRAEAAATEAPGFQSKFKGATDEALSQEASFDARMTSIEGVQAAFREGKISQEEALIRMSKIAREQSNVRLDKMEEVEWSEDRGEAKLSPEHIELWNKDRGIVPREEIAENVPRTGWELEREFAGPFAKSPSEFPEAARVRGGKVKIGADIPTLGRELGRSLYKGNINTIATKELMQNSLDAIGPAQGKLGPNGEVHVAFNAGDSSIEVTDNGLGMTRREVETVFTDLGRSGKRDIDEAMGGFGLAKAAPLLGGKRVQMETVAFDKRRGFKARISFEGTPDEILSGVDLREEIVPMETPTGTRVVVEVEDSYFGEAEEFVKTVARHSQIEGKIFMKGRWEQHPVELTGIMAATKSSVPDKIVTTLTNPSANVTLSIPGDASYGKTSRIKVHLKNKGMYQSTIDVHLGQAMPDVPNEVVANIDALVPEDHADYPFTANRESLRGKTEAQVTKYVQDEIVAPAAKKYSDGVQELYDNMEVIKTQSGRQLAFYDTGGKYTKLEFFQVINTPIIRRIAEQVDTILQQALKAVNNPKWEKKLERVGIIFDESLRGIHIPNPASNGGKSTILVNPLQLMSTRTPDEFAAGLIHTTLHEMAHLEPGWVAHGDDFCIRLGDIYEKFGASRANYQQQTVRAYVTGGSGGYTPEIQKLLQGYTESRGRSATTDDVLTRTGTQQRFGPGGTGEFSPGGKSDGKGTLRNIPVGRTIIVTPKNASPEVVKKLYEEGFRFVDENADGGLRFRKESDPSVGPILEEEVGGVRPTKRAIRGQLGPIQDAQKSSAILEAFNFPRGVMASWDLSAPLRQGLPMIHKREFWTAFKPMMESWASEEGFQAAQKAISDRPLFKKRMDPVTGKELPSFADDAGLKLTDLVDLNSREEAIMSTWAERIPGVRRSNRAYTAFLNNLRADAFEALVKDSKLFGSDLKVNLKDARDIAQFVNTATGRGSLGKLEASASILNTGLFAPRLIASRVDMLTRMLRPSTYTMMNPMVRKEYTKSLLALTAFGTTVLSLAKLAGAEVSLDPTSSDFGKAKIGDKVRLDPWGGFQQYAVLAARLASGKVTSSTSGKEYDLFNKKGPFDPTHADILSRFVRGKTNPVINFAWGLMDAQREMSGKPMQFTTPNPFENSIAQRFIPIFVQDVYQIAKEEPSLLPFLAPAAGLGMGVQVYDNPR